MRFTLRQSIPALIVLLLAVGCGDDRRPGRDAASMDSPAGEAAASCATCETCFSCAPTVAACASARSTCDAEPDCAAFGACAAAAHDDPMLVASCTTMHPAGAAAFCAWWGCLTYEQCDAVCEDAVVCPRP